LVVRETYEASRAFPEASRAFPEASRAFPEANRAFSEASWAFPEARPEFRWSRKDNPLGLRRKNGKQIGLKYDRMVRQLLSKSRQSLYER
jgi:hypothetical protein